MIRINIVRDKKGFIWEFAVEGHSGFSDPGSDIICSAVSAVAYTAVGALDELADIRGHVEKPGFMKCSIPVGIDPDRESRAQVILEAMTVGFKQIEREYEEYVSVFEEEV